MPSEWIQGKAAGSGQASKVQHDVVLKHREDCRITGVAEVISFDEKAVTADTHMGMICVKGENLHVKRVSLDTGELEIEGMVYSIQYQTNQRKGKKGENFVKRLVR